MKNRKIFRFSWEILDQDFCEKELSTPAFHVLFICKREDFANIPPCTKFDPLDFLYDCYSIIRFQFFVRFYIFKNISCSFHLYSVSCNILTIILSFFFKHPLSDG